MLNLSKRTTLMITIIMILLISINDFLAVVRAEDWEEMKSTCISGTLVISNNSSNSSSNSNSNSKYTTNLNALLHSLASNMSNYGFRSSSIGRDQDSANALALCRADLTAYQCSDCVGAAADQLLMKCPSGTQGDVSGDYCMMRYSNEPIIGRQTTFSSTTTISVNNASDENRFFREDLSILLLNLRVQAAKGSSELKVGAGARPTEEVKAPMIYGLVQCTPYLSSEECRRCLADIYNKMIVEIDKSREAKMIMLDKFYNETRLMELQVLPPLPPPPPPSSPPEWMN